MSEIKQIKYCNSTNNQLEVEKVYGDRAVRWLYESGLGKSLSHLIAKKWLSYLYGISQDTNLSANKVPGFVKNFNIQMDDYRPGSKNHFLKEYSYLSFNEFFIREFEKGKREFVQESSKMPAFSEARYFGYEKIDSQTLYPVKGQYLKAQDLIGDKFGNDFMDGPFMIARLCPVDYHRYHYPDNGKTLEHFFIHGDYHSVNPIALKIKNDILIKNERRVSILETQNFGKIAYIEVGATCVGKIIQSFDETQSFKRGDEKGYFLFGGSTVIVLGQKGFWKPTDLMLENTRNGIETYYQLGSEIAFKI